MEPNNPYTSPQSNLFGGSAATSGESVTQGVLLQLQKTKPWVRFMSVMVFIGAGFMLLAGVAMGVMGAAGALKGTGASSAFSAGFGFGLTAVYALIAVLYIYPGMKLWKYANYIRDLLASRQVIDLEKALNEQRAFWKFFGVMMIVVLAIYFVIAIVGVIMGIAAVRSASSM
ncbi:MAG: DUF5362 domain-containing protein [Verrucomicrobia bacterium]|nr:DUF5362 domain-containing protein [Verrucomicrobiota bacterium]